MDSEPKNPGTLEAKDHPDYLEWQLASRVALVGLEEARILQSG